ncbi:MAG: DUF2029 domain-containing protein [Planctomycetes bacterium]|nr:DUF2029 domain-containing protein [Planctomycetota bacterium]
MPDIAEHKPGPLRWISVGVLALVALGFVLQTFGPGLIRAEPRDAMVYWEASRVMQEGEGDIYNTGGWESFNQPYIYPPAFAAAFTPITWLDDRPEMDPKQRGLLRPYPFPAGAYVWVALHAVMWAAAIWLLVCALSDDHTRRLWLAMLATLGTWGAIWMDADFGNVNLLILLMMVAGLSQVLRGRELGGGMLIGAAAMVKIMPGVLFVIFMAQRRWKACGGVALGALALWLLPLLITVPNHGLIGGIGANIDMTGAWLNDLLFPSLRSAEYGNTAPYIFANTSVDAALHRLFGEGVQLKIHTWDSGDLGPLLFALPGWLIKLVGIAAPVAGFGAAVTAAARRKDPRAQWGMAGLAFMAASSANVLFWHYHFCAFAMPIAAAFAVARHRSELRLAVCGLVSIGLFALVPPLLAAGFNQIAAVNLLVWGIPTAGFVAGWVCLWLCLWRATRPQPAV